MLIIAHDGYMLVEILLIVLLLGGVFIIISASLFEKYKITSCINTAH